MPCRNPEEVGVCSFVLRRTEIWPRRLVPYGCFGLYLEAFGNPTFGGFITPRVCEHIAWLLLILYLFAAEALSRGGILWKPLCSCPCGMSMNVVVFGYLLYDHNNDWCTPLGIHSSIRAKLAWLVDDLCVRCVNPVWLSPCRDWCCRLFRVNIYHSDMSLVVVRRTSWTSRDWCVREI